MGGRGAVRRIGSELGFRYLPDGVFAADVISPMVAFFLASISRSSSGPDQITSPSLSKMNAMKRVMVSLGRAALVKALSLSGCSSDRMRMLPTDAQVSSDIGSPA